MAQTNYRAYKWLIFLLADATDQRFGLTLAEINNSYKMHRDEIINEDIDAINRRYGLNDRKEREYEIVEDEETGEMKVLNPDANKWIKKDTISYKTFLNWRAAIWKHFGINIQHPVIDGIAKNSYIIENIEDLDVQKTLREMIVFLSEDEQRAYVDKNPFKSNRSVKRDKKQSNTSATMGFISTGYNKEEYDNPNFGYQYVEEPEMVSVIRFAMTMGESLVIKYSKLIQDTKNQDKVKDNNFVLEPQQLKQINGRWYVIGNLYEYGNRDTIKTVIYDVERIKLSEDEDVMGPGYEVQEGYDLFNFISPNDWNEWTQHFNPDSVVSMYLKVGGPLFEHQPFCPTQIKIEDNISYFVYQIYVKPDKDFFIQYMAYGDEVRLFHPYDKNDIPPLVINEDQYHYLNDLRKREL